MSFAWKNLETCLTGLSHLTKNKQNMQIRWKPFILARSCGKYKKNNETDLEGKFFNFGFHLQIH